MVSIANFIRKFENDRKYVVNSFYTDDFDFPYVSFRINLDAPLGVPTYKEGPGLGFGRAGDLRQHAPARHRFALPVGRPTRERIAIKECSPAERVDDPAVGLVAISGGVDRQTLELLDRDDESDGFVRRWRRMRNMGAL
jgi:hypothetical protein